MERMEGEPLRKRADALRVEGRRTLGRPTPRWEDCVKRDLSRAGGVWRTRPIDKWRGDGGETGERDRGIRGGETAVKRQNETEGYGEGRRL